MSKLGMLGVLFCGLAIGCGGSVDGPQTVRLEGTVKFNGQPVESGEILFRPVNGGASGAARIEGGKFSLDSTLGAKRVEITARRSTGQAESLASGEESVVTEQYVPTKYNQKSELTLNVSEAKDDVSFDLTSS